MSISLEPTKKTAVLSTGIRMAYVEGGTPGATVVILLHGYTDSSRSFFPTLEAMEESEADLHAFAPDLRGHGDSSMPAGPLDAAEPEKCFGPAQLAADVIALMNLLNIAKAHVVGHSNGSVVAQELALTYPDRVSSLVLIGAFARSAGNPGVDRLLVPLVEGRWKDAFLQKRRPGWPEDAHRLSRNTADPNGQRPRFRWPEDAYHLTARDADPQVEAWIAQNWAVEITASRRFVERVVPETAATRLGTWIGVLRNIARFDNRERLTRLLVPVLVIWATQDNFFVESDQAELRASLDAAVAAGRTRYVFKTYGRTPLPASGQQESDLGHNIQWGAARTVADDIAAWVETGRPTLDLPYADPADPSRLIVEKRAARLIEKGSA